MPTTRRDAARGIEVTTRPAWAEWERALSTHTPDPTRRQLGIPNDRPVVFSGHQPVVFHCGILAKLIAQDEAARRTGAAKVWVVADQDDVDLSRVRVPVGRGSDLGAQLVELLPPGSCPPGVAAASLPAARIGPADDERLTALIERLNAYANERSLAAQFAHATIALASERLGIKPPKLLCASELFGLHSEALWQYTHKMSVEPHRCVGAYNKAAAAHPSGRVRLLEIDGERVELPLWALQKQSPRIPIDTERHAIGDFYQERIAPRGLLMSLLVRAHLGELFIHGTGGWAYDQITQAWARDWLGIELAPMALTTATMRLDLGFDTDELIDPHRAAWEAHHARHTPAMLGDEGTQHHKDRLVSEIHARKARGEDPGVVFAELQDLLDRFRGEHRKQIAELDSRLEQAKAMEKQYELADDRTWAFVLFDDEQLASLDTAVRASLG